MNGVEELSIRDVEGGAVISVKAVAGASRDRIVGVLGDCLKIATAAPAEKGKANAHIAAILADAVGVAVKDVTLVTGQTNPRKEFRIDGLSANELRHRLARVGYN